MNKIKIIIVFLIIIGINSCDMVGDTDSKTSITVIIKAGTTSEEPVPFSVFVFGQGDDCSMHGGENFDNTVVSGGSGTSNEGIVKYKIDELIGGKTYYVKVKVNGKLSSCKSITTIENNNVDLSF